MSSMHASTRQKIKKLTHIFQLFQTLPIAAAPANKNVERQMTTTLAVKVNFYYVSKYRNYLIKPLKERTIA